MEPNQRNQYDSKDCLERGDNAQSQFIKIATQKGWKCQNSTSQQDIDEHWDLSISKGDELYKVDVKAMKRISRQDSNVQDSWVWIELHGVRRHDQGWLYQGKSDFVSFEKEKSFIIVKRLDLIQLTERIVDFKSSVVSAKNAQYKVYQRNGRPDKITLIEISKIEAIKWDEWNKSS